MKYPFVYSYFLERFPVGSPFPHLPLDIFVQIQYYVFIPYGIDKAQSCKARRRCGIISGNEIIWAPSHMRGC